MHSFTGRHDICTVTLEITNQHESYLIGSARESNPPQPTQGGLLRFLYRRVHQKLNHSRLQDSAAKWQRQVAEISTLTCDLPGQVIDFGQDKLLHREFDGVWRTRHREDYFTPIGACGGTAQHGGGSHLLEAEHPEDFPRS